LLPTSPVFWTRYPFKFILFHSKKETLMTHDENWKKERDERLKKLTLGNYPPKGNAECIHCGQPFFMHESTGGDVGICQQCIDD